MKKKYQPKKPNRDCVRRESDPLPLKYALVTLVCAALLVAGFFYAARTHFASIDFGIRNAELKRQIVELEAEKRRLLLSKELALAPGEIRKAARKLGLVDIRAVNIASLETPEAQLGSEPKPLVNRTADVRPVATTASRPEKTAGPQTKIEDTTARALVARVETRERRVTKTGN